MATQSEPPSNPSDQNPGSEVVKPASEVHQDANDISSPSVFLNSEPLREDQVQNAVKFLSHPKVKGSPVIYRRSFLERKGLTKEEIDEAFRRVPDPSPTVSTGQLADGHLNSSNLQQQTPTQALQPAKATPIAAVSKVESSTLYRFGWQQALLAVSLLVISGAGTALIFKNSIVPRLKSWIRKVVSEADEDHGKKTNTKPSLAEEAAAAAKAAAIAAADVAQASQDMLIFRNGEKKYFEELMSLLGVQVQEMKSMSNAIRKLEGKSSISGQEDRRISLNSSMPTYTDGNSDFNSNLARPLSPPASVEPSVAPHPKSYMEIMAMVQRGEKPSNIREINDLPPNPNQPVPNPTLAPRPKPWEVGQTQSSSNQALQYQDNGLLKKQTSGNISVPWWQQKQSNNVKINETESVDEHRAGSSGVQTINRPIQRSWVPPQPPPIAMAEAAAAIRQPKKSTIQSEPLTDNQSLAQSAELTNEMVQAAEISESGGATATNGGTSVPNTEIQTEAGSSYIEA